MKFHVGNCTRAVLCAVALIGSLSAADSVFVDQAFNGRWQSPFEVFVFQQISDAEGLRLINSIGDPQFAEKNCPGAAEKREFYGASTPDVLLYGCTNGNTLVGRFTDKSNQGQADTGSFASNPIPDPSGPGGGASPSFDVTINSKVSGTFGFTMKYLGSGLATPLAYVKDQVTLGKATPLSGASLLASEPLPTFQAQVTFKLYTANLASVVLVLADKQGALGTSAPVSVAKTDASTQRTFSIPAPVATRPVESPLTLRAEIHSPSGTVLSTSSLATYGLYSQRGVEFSPDQLSAEFNGFGGDQGTLRISISDPDHSIANLVATKQTEGSGTEWLKITSADPSGGIRLAIDRSKVPYNLDALYWNTIRLKWDGGERSIPVSLRTRSCPRFCRVINSTPSSIFLEAIHPVGSNEVSNVRVSSTSLAKLQVTQSQPNLVDVGVPVAVPGAAALPPGQGFSVRISRSTFAEFGTRSTALKVTAPGYDPYFMLVSTRILPDASLAVPVLSTTSLSFYGTFPPTQVGVNCSSTSLQNPTTRVFVSAVTQDGGAWLQVADEIRDITYCSFDHTGTVTVSINQAALPIAVPGWNQVRGYIKFQIGGVIRSVRVSYNYLMATTPQGLVRAADAGCTPTRALVMETLLPDSFSVPAGAPVALSAQLTDDCGTVLKEGSVTARFSNGDRPIQLQPGEDGSFSANWQPLNPLIRTKVTLLADSADLEPSTLEIEGEITPELSPPPSLEPGRILNSLNPEEGAPLSPGMLVQINGHNMAPGEEPAAVELQIGELSAPILSISESQLIAQIPSELEPGRSYPVLLSVNGSYALPQEIYLVAAQPGAAASPDGRLIAEHADGKLITAANPAQPGETVTLHLVGMGATDPPVPSGVASPGLPMAASRIQPHVTIDGEPAGVLFSGLTPGKVGLYQIRLVVPSNAATGELDVVISQGAAKANTARLTVGRGLSRK